MADEARTGAPLPRSARACDTLVWTYAGWTLLCHAVVACGGGTRALLAALLACGAAALVARALWRRRVRRARTGARRIEPAALSSATDGEGAGGWPLPAPLVAALGGAAVLGLYLATKSVVAAWWASVVFLGGVSLAQLREARAPQPAAVQSPWRERALWAMALAGALLTQLVQRPDIDDAYYVNVAVAMADAPSAPLLARDTLYGIADLPLMLSIYKLHSFELLGGLIAYVTPLSAIQACHWVVPALFGLFIPLALARLLRVLLPRDWLLGVAAACLLLAVTAESHRWYGNFAFVRMQHGKGVFVTVLVPLLVVYAFEYARAPSVGRWLRLCAAQVASLGLTATALWAAPLVAGCALVASVPATRRGRGRLLLGALASGYLVVLGFVFRNSTSAIVAPLALPDHEAPAHGDGAGLVRGAFELSNGCGALAAAALFALVAAWGFCRSGPARRLVAGGTLLFLLLLLDPYAAQLVADYVTSGMTYFRVFWAVPLPVLLTLCLLAPLGLPRLPAGLRVALGVACVTAFLVFAPRVYALSPENLAHVDLFGLKVHPDEYRAAELLVERVPPESVVAASQFVAVYVGTFPHHPALLTSRLDYLEFLEPWLNDVELERRRFLGLALIAPGTLQNPARSRLFEQLLGEYGVRGVVFPRVDPDLARLLKGRGFESAGRTEKYEVWVLP